MRVGLSVALCCVSLACSSEKEQTGTTGAGGSAGSDSGLSFGGSAGAVVVDECQLDADCTASAYPMPISSEADCFCIACAYTPLGKTEDEKRAADWATHCTSWATTHPCPDVDCAQPPMVFCQKPDFGGNRCATPDPI